MSGRVRSASLCSSTNSIDSEEGRVVCSLAELDAVISIFDEEVKQVCHHSQLQYFDGDMEHECSLPTVLDGGYSDGFSTIRSPTNRSHLTNTSFAPDNAWESELPPPPPPEKFPSNDFILPPCPTPPATNPVIEFPPAFDVSHDPVFVHTENGHASSLDHSVSCPKNDVSVQRSRKRFDRPKVPERHPSTRLSTAAVSDQKLHSDITSSTATEMRSDTSGVHNVNVVSSVDETVPAVGDIIRKLSRGSDCPNVLVRTGFKTTKLTDNLPSLAHHQHSDCSVSLEHNQSNPKTKNRVPFNGSTAVRAPSQLPTPFDGLDTSPLPTVQELARGFSSVAATSALTSTTCSIDPPPQLNPIALRKNSGRFNSPFNHGVITASPPFKHHSNTQSEITGQPVDQLSTRLAPTRLSLPDPVPSSPNAPSTGVVIPVQSLRLGGDILNVLASYNIVDAHQIPGFQPLPTGVPMWKVHKLERSNLEAAKIYAEELRKWGQVPLWKRHLLSKRLSVKEDATAAPLPDPHQSVNSVISVELTKKLQRRLEMVDSPPST